LKEITLYSDGVAVETKTVTENFAVFNLTLENFSGNEISASVKDVAGNDSARDGLTKPTDVKTNAFSNFVGLRNEKPTVVITPMNRSVYREGEKNGTTTVWHFQYMPPLTVPEFIRLRSKSTERPLQLTKPEKP